MLMVFEICLTWFLNQVKKNFFFCLISFLFLITLWSKLYVNIIFGSRVLTNFIRQLTRKMEIAQNDNWILIMIWKRGCMFRLLPVRLFVTFCIFYITSSAWILNWSFFLKKPVMFSESLGGFIGSTFIGGKEGGMRLGPSQQNSNFDVFSLKAENFLKCFKCFVGLFL